MNEDQRNEFCRMFYALHLAPFGPVFKIPNGRSEVLQKIVDEMEDRRFAHSTTGEFNARCPGLLHDMPPRPRRLTAEWLDWKEYDAFDPGYKWNGWARPLVTRAQLELLLPDHNSSAGSIPEDPYLELGYDGVLVSKYGDERVEIFSKDYAVSEPLYDIGSLGLCWEWGEEEVCPCGSTEFKTAELFTSTARVCVQCGKEQS